MILNLVIGLALGVSIIVGFVIGFLRGYTKTRKWAGEYFVSSMLSISIGAIFTKLGVNPVIAGPVMLVVSVGLVFGCMGLSIFFQRLIIHAINKSEEETFSPGPAGIINRIWGGVVLAIKGFIICCFVVVPIVLVLDLAKINVFHSYITSVTDYAFWQAVRPVLFDFVVLGAINIAVRHGYSTGVISSLWVLFVFALVAGAGFLSYNLVFNTGTFDTASAALGTNIASLLGGVDFIQGIAQMVARWILAAGIFIVVTIIIVIAACVIGKKINFARGGKIFYIVDGVLGAVVMFFISIVIIMAVGYIIQPIADLEFMKAFTDYFQLSTIARYFYVDNILIRAGVPVLIPLRSWLS